MPRRKKVRREMESEAEVEAEAEAEDRSAVTDLIAEGVGLLASIKDLLTEVRDDVRRERQSRRNAFARLWEELEEVKEKLGSGEIYQLAASKAMETWARETDVSADDATAKETDDEAEGGK